MLPGQLKSIGANMSLPTRGGWIEITLVEGARVVAERPSPHGEGGLKLLLSASCCGTFTSLPTRGGWIEIEKRGQQRPTLTVPPHTGRVD